MRSSREGALTDLEHVRAAIDRGDARALLQGLHGEPDLGAKTKSEACQGGLAAPSAKKAKQDTSEGSLGDASRGCVYFEAQEGAWCGMHALNNYLQGPYVTKDACRTAADIVSANLSQVGGGDAEDSGRHLHPETGWLSIDVINVLGATLGIEVEGAATTVASLL